MADQGSLHSFLDYELLLFHCDGSDLRVGHFFGFRCPLVNTPQLNTQSQPQSDLYEWRPTYESITCPFIPRCEPNTEHYLEQFVCYCVYSLSRERVYRTVV
jgi:hypothetical protein